MDVSLPVVQGEGPKNPPNTLGAKSTENLNTVQGRVRAKIANFGKNRVFHHFGCIGFLVVGHAEAVCIIVAVPACVRFCLDCAHAYASRHACHCANVFLSLCAEVK